MKYKNTQPSYIFHRENPQNAEPQNGPRRGLDFIALWAGNGYCDDPVNTVECGFDLGDCCPKDAKDTTWKQYCKYCECKQEQ